MRFLFRALSGTFLFVLTLALIGAAVWRVQIAIDSEDGRKSRPPMERTYVVVTDTLRATTTAPEITAFGEIRAWRTLEIRAATAGPITALDENFKDGAWVPAGTRLFAIDPADAERNRTEADIKLSEARLNRTEADAALKLVQSEVVVIASQVKLRRDELKRKKDLRRQGHAAQSAVDTGALALSTASQSLIAKRQGALAAQARLDAAALAVKRAGIDLDQAERDLADTVFTTPFAGRLNGVVATLGRRVSQNEKLGDLLDPTAMEAAFRIPDAAFGRLLDKANRERLRAYPVTVTLDLGSEHIVVAGTLDRAAAVVDANLGGRRIFARLDAEAAVALRPGDFVSISVREKELVNVSVVPASALTADGRLFLVGDDSRLKEVTVEILRRQGENIVVSRVPLGRQYVQVRTPQLATGIKIRTKEAANRNAAANLIALSDKRRQALIAMVEKNKRIPGERKKYMLDTLAKPKVPQDFIERLESRMKPSGGGRS